MTSIDQIRAAETVRCARPRHDVAPVDDDDDEDTGVFVRAQPVERSHRWLLLAARVVGGAAGLTLAWWMLGGEL
jgi:hypothetical protein